MSQHDAIFKDQYRMQIRNFDKFVGIVSPLLHGEYNHEIAVAVWLDWVTGGDPSWLRRFGR